jgi:hypothetical protein
MNWKAAISAVAILAALPVRGDEVAQNVRETMRTAMLEQAPLPSGRAALPDRLAPAIPRTQLARTRAEAGRAAREHAMRNAAAAHAEAANQAAMSSMRSASRSGGGPYGCDEQLPADMMKSRGTMPGGGAMPGMNTGGGTPGGAPGNGMPGMLVGPNSTSTGAPSQRAVRR